MRIIDCLKPDFEFKFKGYDLVLVLVIAIPYILAILTNTYLPVTDEAYQLEAAVNLAAGHGYVASRELGADLSITSFQYMTAWPRGYSLVLSWLIDLGLSLNYSAIILKLSAVALSIWGWVKVSHLALRRIEAKLIFSAFLGFYVVVVATSASDLILFSLFPIIVLLLVDSILNSTKVGVLRVVLHYGALGFLGGIAVLFKYTALPIVLMSVMVIVGVNRKDGLKAILQRTIIFILPVAVIVVAIFSINYLNAKSISTITDIGLPSSLSFFRIYWIKSLIEGFLIEAPFLPKIIFGNILGRFNGDIVAICKALYEVLTITLLVIVCIKNFSVDAVEDKLRKVTLAATFSVLIFLYVTTLLFYNGTEYNPLQHGRYYQYVVPLILILILAAAQSICEKKLQGPYLTVISVTLIFIFGFAAAAVQYSRYLNEIMRSEGSSANIVFLEVNKLKEITKSDNPIIFADGDSFHSAPWRGLYRTFYQCPKHNELNYSRDTLTILVCGRDSSRVGLNHQDSCNEMGYSDLAAKEGFSEIKVAGNKSVFWKVMKKNI